MASDGLCWMPASEMAAAIRRKKVSPVEVMKEVLARIDRLNPTLNAFVTLTAEQAMRDARAAERALGKKGAKLGPLHGVPFSTKDLVLTKGIRTTFGTRLYADNVPTETAPMVERMLAAGAIQLGKTNTPTFGWIGHPRHTQPLDPTLERLDVVHPLRGQGERVARIGTGAYVQHERGVRHRPRHRTDVGEAPHRAARLDGNPSIGGLVPDDARERRGDPDGASAVGADG